MTDAQPGHGWSGFNEYWPREPFRKFHVRTQRFSIIVAHRRAGKTVACVADLVGEALHTKKQDARFAYIAPHFNQAKDVAWLYVKRLTTDIPGVQLNESELRADFPNGSRVRLYGAENPDRLRGLYLDGVIMDEFADMRPSVYSEVVRPMLMDRRGWVSFIGTPKGHNQFYDIWADAQDDPRWFKLMLKASESGLIPPEELDAARREMTEEQYAQEMEGSFEAAILGSYYGKEISDLERAGQITKVDYDSVIPVHTAWDLGIGPSATAIWCFQVVGDEIHVIDYIEGHGNPLGHYVRVLNSKGYDFGIDYLPHDAQAREQIAGRTRVEYMRSLNRDIRVVRQHKVEDGINAVKLTLPKVWFDKYKCADGIEALRQYQTDYDEKLRKFKETPRGDWASHAADAFRYLCISYREKAHPDKRPEAKFRTEALSDGQILIHDVDDLSDLEDEYPKPRGYRRI